MNQPELLLERNILLALGAQPDVWLHKNVVGQAFHAALHKQLCSQCKSISQRFRFNAGLGDGSPDLFCLVSGHAALMELKSLTGRLRETQKDWHSAAAKRGILVRTIRSVDEALGFVEEVRKL